MSVTLPTETPIPPQVPTETPTAPQNTELPANTSTSIPTQQNTEFGAAAHTNLFRFDFNVHRAGYADR